MFATFQFAIGKIPQRPKNLGSRVALLPRKFLRPESFCAYNRKIPCQLSQYIQNDPNFSRWLPIFRIISKLSGFFQMAANLPDYFKTVRIFPDDCQFSRWFQNCPDVPGDCQFSGWFQNCPDFELKPSHHCVNAFCSGAQLKAKTECVAGHKNNWQSSPDVGEKGSTAASINVDFCSSLLLSGLRFTRVKAIFSAIFPLPDSDHHRNSSISSESR